MDKLQAIELLLKCDPTTVIDDIWWEYFMEDPTYYNAMIELSGLNSYKEILDIYEGLYVREFLCKVLNFECEIK